MVGVGGGAGGGGEGMAWLGWRWWSLCGGRCVLCWGGCCSVAGFALLLLCLFAFAVTSWPPRRSLSTEARTLTTFQGLWIDGCFLPFALIQYLSGVIGLFHRLTFIGAFDVAIACLTISW